MEQGPEVIPAEDLDELVRAGGLTRIIEDALEREAQGGAVDLQQLWRDIKEAVLEDDQAPEDDEPAALLHAAASLSMGPSAAAATAVHLPSWRCKLKRDLKADWPGGPTPDCIDGIKAPFYERAKPLCAKLARKHSRQPVRMKKGENPKRGHCS
jgi:hypothetical protein